MTSKSEMKRKNALAGKPLDEGLAPKTASVLCPICLVGAKDTSEAECVSCRAPVKPPAPGKSEIPREAGKRELAVKNAESRAGKYYFNDDYEAGLVEGFIDGYDARDEYLLKLHGEGAMAEVIQLQAEVARLKEDVAMHARIADKCAAESLAYKEERDEEVARLKEERRLTEVIAEEKCRCFLVRAEAAEAELEVQRADELESWKKADAFEEENKRLRGIEKDHLDDCRRIQDAERDRYRQALEELAAMKGFSEIMRLHAEAALSPDVKS